MCQVPTGAKDNLVVTGHKFWQFKNPKIRNTFLIQESTYFLKKKHFVFLWRFLLSIVRFNSTLIELYNQSWLDCWKSENSKKQFWNSDYFYTITENEFVGFHQLTICWMLDFQQSFRKMNLLDFHEKPTSIFENGFVVFQKPTSKTITTIQPALL